ncbi:MAG: preprotein translocase subunit SecY [Methanobacteriota archaeon]
MNLEFLRPAIKYLPEVSLPKRHIPFKEKLIWTGAALILFFIMGTIYPVGVSPATLAEKIAGFSQLQMIFASKIGTIISTGIGPIVTSSIILQLLHGAEMINIDTKTQEGKALFQGTQKILTIIIAFFEAAALVIATKMVAGQALIAFTVVQIALGSIVLMYVDEVVSKWGIGSGISLFIAAGVSETILIQSINPLRGPAGTFAGIIPNFLDQMISGTMQLGLLYPILATIIVFVVVVYGESMRIELPLSHVGLGGYKGRYPLRFFYVSNIPVILAAALLANVQMWASFAGVDIYNPPQDMTIVQNVVYQVGSMVTLNELHGIISPGRVSQLLNIQVLLHLIIYLIAFTALCVVFGKFWVQTTNIDSDGIAKQIQDIGMQIPRWRQDGRIVKKVLDKYIPQLTIISSIAVGLLAAGADLIGAIGSGTGILLTVGILYRFYEEIQREQMSDMPQSFRRLMGKA